ncbi:MAG: S24/S26 family peptidase [Clostridiales bacterium]|nr:S24/S26 family peptidase [Clostridiales bacterium]
MNGYSELNMSMSQLVEMLKSNTQMIQEISVTVNGTSMEPFLHDGKDSVIFSQLPKKLRRGDILLFKRKNGSFAMHRVYSINKNGTVSFLGDSQSVVEKDIPPEDIVLYVPTAIRNGKRINCTHGFWRFVMTCYMPARVRYPVAAYKTFNFLRRVMRAIVNPRNAIGKLKKTLFKYK